MSGLDLSYKLVSGWTSTINVQSSRRLNKAKDKVCMRASLQHHLHPSIGIRIIMALSVEKESLSSSLPLNYDLETAEGWK